MDSPILLVAGGYKAWRMKTSHISIFISAALFMQLGLAATVHAEPTYQNAAYFNKGECGLTVEDPHISDSMLKKGRKGMKVNVTSTCIYAQESVIFDIQLLKKGSLGWRVVESFPKKITYPKGSPFKIERKDAFVECTNNKKTIYMARASSKSRFAGKVYQTPLVYSNETGYISCGT